MPPRPPAWLRPGVQAVLLFAILNGCMCHEPLAISRRTDVTWTDPPESLLSGGADSAQGGECVDADGDGYGVGSGCLGPDCDDADPALGANGTRSCYSGPAGTRGVGACAAGTQTCTNGVLAACSGDTVPADEVCDGVDNDCDGELDEALVRTCYGGPDGTDGVGVCHAGQQTCAAGAWSACAGEVTPQAETCDGVDNNCDGQADEALVRSCYDGPAGTAGVGVCAAGTQACVDGQYGACTGQVLPGTETCDAVDNDCNGQVDEQLVRSCYEGPSGTAGVGVCHAGTQTCSNGAYGACVGQALPGAETCDAQDNDCDGQVDEQLVRTCYDGPAGTDGVGVCHGGTQTCSNGSYGACAAQVLPATETCDAQDNDCDGTTDEQLTRSCYDGPSGTDGVGVCHAGTQTCSNGAYGTCAGQALPSVETCDAQDNNCDGKVDEALVRTCYEGPAGTDGVGVCHAGSQTCTNGAYGACEGQALPTAETCDAQDNNCDGQVDEEQTRSCYSGPPGTAGVGACRAGTQLCASGDFGTCSGEVTPTEEVCDGIDNDCDGEVDEALVRSCYDGPAGTQGVGVCAAGTQTCSNGAYGACVGQVLPGAETCDAQDNDCDGQVDEQLVRTCYDGPAGSAGVGVCHAGQQTCSNGTYGACEAQVLPGAETCDAVDNDCDGEVDEALVRSCYGGPAGTDGVGVCHAGQQTCSAGGWGACSGEVAPQAETCDALDNNCDGQVDEQLVRTCYGGPAGTDGVGVCHGGTQACTNGAYGACQGQALPSAETCDALDNDCNGQVDEALVRTCYDGPAGTAGVGVCASGTQTCSNGAYGSCSGEVLPQAETCDAQDNDCDGQVDEALVRSCYDGPSGTDGVGVCHAGSQTCTNGAYGACAAQVTPGPETCDAQDNDCDGEADEQVARSCYTGPAGTAGVGACQGGTQTCTSGDFGTCAGEVTPTLEVCDGIDNDCDGQVDEELVRSCYDGPGGTAGVGVCHAGSQTCSAGSWGSCSGQVMPTAETCDAQDNDCDGTTDEALVRTCYDGPAGTDGVGVCHAGTQACTNGAYGACTGQALPGTETCDALDNNCDGQVDEALVRSCYDGPGGTAGVGVCHAGSQTCSNGAYGACEGQALPTTEVCDAQDNDCDGQLDEALVRSCYDGPSGTQNVGVCHGGNQTCSAGAWGTCAGQQLPGAEVCDAQDNNCDGTADELLFRDCYQGPAGTQGVGVCVGGTQVCTAGDWGVCGGQVTPSAETCDAKDNDCDAQVDEQLVQACYGGPPNTAGVGVCHGGNTTCSMGVWGACEGQVTPTTEVCDAQDNDCDTQVDEALVQACYDGPAGTAGVGICRAGSQTCAAGAWGTCTGQVLPALETCDAQDNDCNGTTDENLFLACYGGPAGTEGVGICRAGTRTCSNGTYGACVGEVLPAPETCDTRDNNCNQSTDENLTRYRHDRGNEAPPAQSKQVDLIIVVDNSGSMKNEILSVEENLNVNLAQALQESGLDYRIILVTKHSPDSSAQGICIHTPLSSNDCTTRTKCPINGPRFFHYNHEISNDDPLRVLTETYNVPDGCTSTKGWSEWLRPGVQRYFLLITDGERSGINASDLSADAFEAALFKLSPPAFGTSLADRNYRFHLIGGLYQATPPEAPWMPPDPIQTAVCTSTKNNELGDGADQEYQKLARRTGGLRFAICAYPQLGEMFRDVVDDMRIQPRYPCSFVVRSIPPDSSMANTYGEFWPTNGGGPNQMPHVSDAPYCAGDAFYNDGATVYLCPEACNMWLADPTALIDIIFTCSNQVGVPR